MGLLSGLKELGLGSLEDTTIIEDKKQEKKADEPVIEKTPEELELEAIFDRTITCPVCDLQFKTKVMRPGKAKLEGTDTDLRPRYEKMDPLKYDAIACTNCGYAGLTKYFPHLASRQLRDVKEQICAGFKGYATHEGIYTYDDAIMRYKLALVSTVVKKAKNSERAYTALKLAWVLRGKREGLEKELNPAPPKASPQGSAPQPTAPQQPAKPPLTEEQKKEYRETIVRLYEDEKEALGVAYDGFTISLSKESAPIANMDENTVVFLLAELAHRLKKYDEASRLCGIVLTNKDTQPRLKERAYDLKEAIQAEMKKQKEAAAAAGAS
ncbi:MAG: DUF2225 domain-containing protein [Lachnospiraceae bacterium]|nr:DUF2225 domain-containing protein [Lachnospiraceae bacterium]